MAIDMFKWKQDREAKQEAELLASKKAEREEFTRLLQYFLEVQEPKFPYLKVEIKENKFTITDGKYTVDDDYLKKLIQELDNDSIDDNDLLISNLISLAPSKLEMYVDKITEVVETIKAIFGNRVTIHLVS
jgi:putative sporulation protein YtxC